MVNQKDNKRLALPVSSRGKFLCLVCTKSFRSDKLQEHYSNNVRFGLSDSEVSKLDNSIKAHTECFL